MTTNKKITYIIAAVIIVSIIVTKIHFSKSPGVVKTGTSALSLPPSKSVKVYPIDKGWAYEIYIDSSLFLFQESIPGLTGKQVFTSKNDALKCGELVIEKLNNGELPAITINDLDSLKIQYSKN